MIDMMQSLALATLAIAFALHVLRHQRRDQPTRWVYDYSECDPEAGCRDLPHHWTGSGRCTRCGLRRSLVDR